MTTPTHQTRQPAGDLRRTTPTSSDSSVSPEATDRFTLIVEVKPNLVENLRAIVADYLPTLRIIARPDAGGQTVKG